MDREKVVRAFEQYVYNFVELTTTDEYNHQILEQVLAVLKEQDETIKELQNAYGYLQKQFFEAQDKLLKEQEAVEPYVAGNGKSFETAETWWYECGNCNKPIDPNDKFCRHCGRSVKWE